ncbi:MAG: Ig-like domain-containing protein [Chloroflexi bacterium]|nr:Ig-like domain-containing protein [Chloroflexota bacterium]
MNHINYTSIRYFAQPNPIRKRRPTRQPRLLTLIILVTLVSMMLSSCKATPAPEAEATAQPSVPAATATPLPPQPPKLLSMTPQTGEELAENGAIILRFDQAMDRASVEQALTFTPALVSQVSWENDSTLRITPKTGGFTRDTIYQLVITNTAKSSAGVAVKGPLRMQAQTVGFLEVSDVAPSRDNADVAIDSPIRVAFNRPVVPLLGLAEQAGLSVPLQITPQVTGKGEWINTSLYSFTPDALKPGTRYTVTIAGGLQDTIGGILETDYTWSFTTQVPAVTHVVPENLMVYASPAVTVQLTFNQPMNQQAAEERFSLMNADNKVAGQFRWQENTLVFMPAQPLAKGDTYYVKMDAGTPALSGEATVKEAFESRFTVAPKPTVISYTPADGETLFKDSKNIVVTFSSPMSPTLDNKGIRITPKVDLYTYWSDDATVLNIAANLKPSTRYTITLNKELTGRYGDALSPEQSFSFTTAPTTPQARLMTYENIGLYNLYTDPSVSVQYVNVSRLDFAIYRLSERDFIDFNSDDSWQKWQDYTGSEADLVRRWSVQVKTALNEVGQRAEPLADNGGSPLPSGYYMLVLSSDAQTSTYKHLVILTDMNLVLKSTIDHALVWATDLESGQAVADVALQFIDSAGTKIQQATTDQHGLAEAAFTAQEPWQRLVVLAKRGDTLGAVVSTWANGITPWDFDINYNPTMPVHFAYLYTERQIYRPGQQVYYKGILRLDNDAQYQMPAANTAVDIDIYDSQGRQILHKTLVTNEFGSFNDSFLLAEGAATGVYQIQASVGGESYYTYVQVAEYRKPDFAVTIASAQADYLPNEQIQASGEAHYYTGNPAAQAAVLWRVSSQPYYFDRWTGEGNYSFGDYDYAEMGYNVESGSNLVAEGSTTTDSEGHYNFQLIADLSQKRLSQVYMLEASVTDASNQEVSERTSTIVHKGAFYIGVAPDDYIGTVGKPLSVSLITVDTQGITSTKRSLVVSFIKREWYSVQEMTADGSLVWANSISDTTVISYPVETDALGRATVGFTPSENGSYKVLVTGKDEQGNSIASSDFIWVSGEDYVNWGRQDNNRIDLVADKKSYTVGDVARILVPSPFQGQYQALLTIERGQVIEKRVISLEGTSQIIEIPITAEYAPNIYVSLYMIKGTDAENPEPAFRLGYVMLPISVAEKELTVSITPSGGSTYRPGEQVTYNIEVHDAQGAPVEAEVSLDLVDLAVWTLSGGDSRDILGAFYSQRAAGVQTSASLSMMPERLAEETPAEGKGGSGGIADSALTRGTFKDTAMWEADVKTDANGRAVVSVMLPDNLTTWRMTGIAVTADTKVGRGYSDVISRLDLMIRPVTPRFMVTGDKPQLGCTLQNETDQALELTVTLEAAGLDITDAEQHISIAAHGQATAVWDTVVNTNEASVKLKLSAAGGGYQDAVELSLPVYHPSSPEVVGTAGEVEQTIVELIHLPEGIDRSLGSLTVQVDPSLAAGMRSGLKYLETYEYACIEQIISRFLPNLAIYYAQTKLGIAPDGAYETLPDEIAVALQQVYAQQNPDGGWGWWYGETSDPVLTAYVLQGLTRVKESDFAVEPYVFQRTVDFLVNWLADQHVETRQLNNQKAEVLYALAEAGSGDVGRTVALYSQRSDMALYAQARLAVALSILVPDDSSRPQTLLDNLVGQAVLSAGGVTWQEAPGDKAGLSSDTRSTAIILRALIRLDPNNALIPNTVRWLMTARSEGHWPTTQETASAILALTDYMVYTGELNPDYTYEVSLDGALLTEAAVDSTTVSDSFTQQVPITELQDVNPLVLEKSAGAGALYYNAYMKYYLPAAELQPLNRGLVVQRQYWAESAPGVDITTGSINQIITVKLTLIVPHDVYYVYLEDPIPAGAEIVDTSLHTTRQIEDPYYEKIGGEEAPADTLDRWIWGWSWATHTELRDNKVVLFAGALARGTYEYTYQLRCTTAGEYQVMPAQAYEMYQPDRFGRTAGMVFTIAP